MDLNILFRPVANVSSTHLDEGLDFAPESQLLLAHASRHFSGVTLDSGNDGVGEGPAVGALIHLLDDNNLFAGLTALEDDCDLSAAQHLVRVIGANFRVRAYLAGLVYCQSIGQPSDTTDNGGGAPLTILMNGDELDYCCLGYCDEGFWGLGNFRGGLLVHQIRFNNLQIGQFSF